MSLKKLVSIGLLFCLSVSLLPGCSSKNSSGGDAVKTSATGSADSNKAVRLKLSVNANQSQRDMAEAMVQKMEELSGGSMIIDVYGEGQLGGDREVAEATQYGNIDICLVSTTPVATFYPDLNIFDAPFLFKDSEQAQGVLDGEIGDTIKKGMENVGFKVLGFPENGFRVLSTDNVEVHSPADLKGMKVRVMESEVHIETWKALGANPTPMAFSELFTALQQGTVTAQDNPLVTDYDNKFYEVQKYIILTNHVYTPYLLMMNKDKYDSLTDEQKAIIDEVGKYGVEVQRTQTAIYNDEAAGKMAEAGANVIKLTDEELGVFRESVSGIYDLIETKVDDKELFQSILKATE